MLLSDLRHGARLNRFPPVVRYAVGLSLFALALASRFALIGIFPAQGFPFLTFFPAVLLGTFLGGFGVGLFVSGLSILSAWYFFIAPVGAFAGISRPDQITLAVFAAVLLVDCIVIHVMNVAMAALRRRDAELSERNKALRASEEKYRTLFTNMTEGFILGDTMFDERGGVADVRFIEVNEAFYQQTGIARGPMGRGLRQMLPHIEQSWIDRYARVALSGQATRFDSFNVDTGRHYDVYAFSPAAGQFASLFLDITEQKRVEKALRESEAYLRHLITTLPGMVWTTTPDGAMDFVSQQWLDYTGTTLESQLGAGGFHCIHPEDRDNAYDAWRAAVRNKDVFQVQFRLRRHDGQYRWFHSRGTPIHGEDGTVSRWLGVMTDIDDLKHTQEALVDSEQRYTALFNNKTNAIAHCRIVADEQGRPVNYRVEAVNDAYERTIGISREQVEGKLATESFPGIERFEFDFIAEFGRIGLEGGEGTFEVHFPPTGQWLSLYAYSAKQGECTVIFSDITERKQADQRVREAALHDTLTGLPNRALVFEYGGHCLAAAQRNHGRGALLFIDLDRFKPINDLYGHEIGDRVLQEVGKRLVRYTRHEDLVGRLGGDEFVILLPHLDGSRDRAAVVAQHVIDSISQPFCIDTLELSVSPSIGISYYPDHATDVGALIHCADLAMYQVKQSGRASYRLYTPELDQRAEEAYWLEARLKNALRNGGLALHYQPVVDIRSGRLIGAEALVRLEDGGNEVGPGSFIPVAESAGLIGELGEWVAAEACRQHEAWRGEGLQVTIAINVSPLQFRQRDFSEKLSRIIADTGVDPNCLQLEVTESAVMESLDEAVKILSRIKALGVKVSLDDFGTGYSSLSSLSSLPLDKLKVDQSFVRRIENDQASRAVTEAIIALARSLRLEVIGEGIESENALCYLREHGCDQAQGYWFSQPLPAPEFAQWCREKQVA